MAISIVSFLCVPPEKGKTLPTVSARLRITIDPLIGIALIILASLALRGQLSICKRGAYAMLVLGMFEVSGAIFSVCGCLFSQMGVQLRAAC